MDWLTLKETTGKRISTCYVAKYAYFPKIRDEGRGAEKDSFRNKTDISAG